MGAKATMLDVAKAAGVAVGTVSNRLNSSVHVSPKTAKKIDDAIARLGYRIHLGARSLRAQRTHTVGLLLPSISNPFYAEIARAMENALWDRGYQMLLGYSSLDENRELKQLDNLESRRVDGIFMIYSSKPPRERLKRMSLPVVCLDRAVEGQLSVTTDNILGGRLAARHLVALGHRRIAILAGQPSDLNIQERLRGFTAVLSEQADSEEPQLLTGPEQAIELGYEVGRLLEGGRHPPTAIFATNDTVGVGAWRSLLELGIRVPQDISIIGYDDIEMTRLLIPPMTTVAQDKAVMAREAVGLLLKVLESGAPPAGERPTIRVPPRLIVRGSTAPPRSVEAIGVRPPPPAYSLATKPARRMTRRAGTTRSRRRG
jgi:LacI family transcriptional regulator